MLARLSLLYVYMEVQQRITSSITSQAHHLLLLLQAVRMHIYRRDKKGPGRAAASFPIEKKYKRATALGDWTIY